MNRQYEEYIIQDFNITIIDEHIYNIRLNDYLNGLYKDELETKLSEIDEYFKN